RHLIGVRAERRDEALREEVRARLQLAEELLGRAGRREDRALEIFPLRHRGIAVYPAERLGGERGAEGVCRVARVIDGAAHGGAEAVELRVRGADDRAHASIRALDAAAVTADARQRDDVDVDRTGLRRHGGRRACVAEAEREDTRGLEGIFREADRREVVIRTAPVLGKELREETEHDHRNTEVAKRSILERLKVVLVRGEIRVECLLAIRALGAPPVVSATTIDAI